MIRRTHVKKDTCVPLKYITGSPLTNYTFGGDLGDILVWGMVCAHPLSAPRVVPSKTAHKRRVPAEMIRRTHKTDTPRLGIEPPQK